MHELAAVEELIRELHVSAVANGIKRISKVRLVVGRLAAMPTEGLRLAFEFSARGPLLAGTILEIDETAGSGQCRTCKAEFTIAGLPPICPSCASAAVDVITGRELFADHYEGEQ